MGRSTASVEPAPGDGGPERPNDVGPNDNKATELNFSAALAAENPRGSGPRLGGTGPPFPKGSRREQLRREETMRYDPEDELTFLQRMWMLLDDPSFSKGTPRLSLVAH